MEKLGLIESDCAVSVLCVVTAIASPAQTFTALHNFGGTDGVRPNGLVQGTDGNFYGTTVRGGVNATCSGSACGTVFQITPSGTLNTLHSFDGTDGEFPVAGPIQGSDGKFYGTANAGGIFPPSATASAVARSSQSFLLARQSLCTTFVPK